MKRTRFAALGLVAAVLIAFSASPAGASETVGACIVEKMEEAGGAEAVEEIIHDGEDAVSDEAVEEFEHLEEELESCVEAPNPILPETKEIIWGSLAFLVLLGVMWKWAFPAVKSAMDARADKIRSDLDAAEAAKMEAETIKAQHAEELANAKTEAAAVIDAARQEAGTVRADLQQRAETDIQQMREQGAADVAAARERALADLQSEVSDIVVGAAERVVETNLDREAQTQLIENYIAQVGARQ